MPFWEAIRTGFRKYAEFRGTARRSEFWWWILFAVLVHAALNAVPVWHLGMMSAGFGQGDGLSGVWTVVALLPTLAVTVRRLADAGYARAHILWVLLPLAGLIVLAVLCTQPSRNSVQPPGARSDSPAVHEFGT